MTANLQSPVSDLSLTSRDRARLSGEFGPAVQMAMSIIVRMAEVNGAKELMDISGAHIDSTIYIGEAGLEFAERLARLGAKVAVPTTLNVSGLDEHGGAVSPRRHHARSANGGGGVSRQGPKRD